MGRKKFINEAMERSGINRPRPFRLHEELFMFEYAKDLDEEAAWDRAREAIKQNLKLTGRRPIGETKYKYITLKTVLKNKGLVTRIAKLRDSVLRARGITSEVIQGNIDRIAEKAENVEDFGNALRGNELLGKSIGMFKDAAAVNVNAVVANEEMFKEMQKVIDARKQLGNSAEIVADGSGEGAGTESPGVAAETV